MTPLPHNFHEGSFRDWQIGPRRELTLWITVTLLPPGRTAGLMNNYDYRLRFGAIENFEEVRAFFEPDLQAGLIGNLTYDENESSRSDRLFFRFAMMDGGDPVLKIRCRNLTIVQETHDVSPEGK